MENPILCSHCQTPAVAEIDGDYVCTGCLMSIVMCLDEALPITPVNTAIVTTPSVSDAVLQLKHVYQNPG